MIVRVSGVGQYELDDTAAHRLEELDRTLTEAVHGGDEEKFHTLLKQTIAFVEENGTEVPHDTVRPSDVIIPPDDISLPEAQRFFEDEGLMHPLPA
jgi:hypothetical protein